MKNYTLHSQGDNWFHFRNDPESAVESFSVTFCHDGTVCMTGDYGCLSWRREWFTGKQDYGFPNKLSGLGYFAQKVVRAEEDQKIKTWNRELAIKEITEAINEFDPVNEDANNLVTLKSVLDVMDNGETGEYGHHKMLDTFMDLKHSIDGETWCNYGMDYTDSFKRKYDLLTSVSDIILQTVHKKKERTP